MFRVKPISKESVAVAHERALRYRLLNEPMQAESICLDILEVDPDNQQALTTLLLALTDQFELRLGEAFGEVQAVLEKLHDNYSRLYYRGIICERRGKAHLKRGGPGSGHLAFDWFQKAMASYEEAEKASPPDNDEAILRWNSCSRILKRNPELTAGSDENIEHMLE